MKNLIVRSRQNVFRHETELLCSTYGFQEINNGVTSKGIKTPIELAFFFLKDFLFIVKNLRKISHSHTLIVTGFNALTIKLLIKLNLLKCDQLLWFGFFIHTEKAFKVFRFVLSFLKIKNEKIILNAWYELPLYAQRLNLKESHLDCMPLGDWQDNEFNNPDYQPPLEDYYFAGGFTNRDYAGLIEAFKSRKENLIIVGSKLNSDLNVDDLPGNILILKDIDKFTFESLVAQSSACILPMKDPDAGASGHMVLLAYMRHKKLILASNFPAIREYLEDGVSALLYNDPLVDLPKMISDHQPSNDKSKKLGEQAYITYQQNFTRQALTKRLIEIIESNVPQNKWKSQAS